MVYFICLSNGGAPNVAGPEEKFSLFPPLDGSQYRTIRSGLHCFGSLLLAYN